jgi:hypothetical protein
MGTTRICPRCGGSFSGTLDLCPKDRTPLFAPEVIARAGMEDGPAGDDQPAGEEELANLDSLDWDGFSGTMRIDSFRARKTRRLLVGAAIAILVGAGSALWIVQKNRTPELPHATPVAAAPPPAAQPVAPRPVAASPPAVVAPAPIPAAKPTQPPANPPLATSADRASARPRRAVEDIGRRAPAGFPSYPTPRPFVAPTEPAPPIPTQAEPEPPAPTPAAPVRPAGDPEAMLREAQQAWLRHHFAVAVDKARSALALSPDQPLAYQIIAVCSCALHNTEDAQQASAHLEPARRKLVRAVCEKDGVVLDPN